MNNQKLSDTIEINLIDLVFKVLYQWKLIIPFSLIIGLLVSGLMYVRDTNRYNNTVAFGSESEASLEDYTTKLTEEEIASVYDVSALEAIMKDNISFRDNAPTMKVDPYNVHRLNLSYLIKTNSTVSSVSIRKLYEDILLSSDSIQSLSNAIGEDVDSCYLEDLVSLNKVPLDSVVIDEEQKEESVLKIEITLLPDVNAQKIKDSINDTITNNYEYVSEKLGEHSIDLIFEDESVSVDRDLADSINIINSNIISNRTSVKNSLNALSNDQKALYEFLANQDKNQIEDNTESIEEVELTSPSFSIKYLALGIILGAFLYCLMIFLKEILAPTVSEADELASTIGLRSFGEVYSFAPSGFMPALTSSRFIYNLRYKKHLNSDNQISLMTERICTYCTKKDLKEVTIVSVSEMSEIEKATIDSIIKQIGDKGIAISVLSASDATPDISNEKSIIPVLLSNKTKYRSLDELFGLCRDYGIDVLGTVFIG